ncbi:MAG: (2Fe-2S)-binding protein [Candidatus Eremiobacteraeota bacterium]|nr:(2Fe-2S)-binding protein [Candidatus Eremiobacteraeota bacterium]
MSRHKIEFSLNGEKHVLSVDAHRVLLDVLRDDCKLTGTKEGCGIGVCGSCSVIIDGKLMSACLVLAATVDGCDVQTIEGIAQSSSGQAVGEAFVRCGGFQCGICTSGQVVAATALLEQNPAPNADDVRAWMMGNLCRCTGYYQIVEAVLAAWEQR